MISDLLFSKLASQPVSIDAGLLFEISKAHSGGDRDVKFLQHLLDNKLLQMREYGLHRPEPNIVEEYYLDRYKKMKQETDRHFLCRTILQDQLGKMSIPTMDGVDVGDMNILRLNSHYDIVAEDYSFLIDLGLTPARNYFRGLSDLRVQSFLLTNYFDDYTDKVIFSTFSRSNDKNFIEALKEYEEGFRVYPSAPGPSGLDTELNL